PAGTYSIPVYARPENAGTYVERTLSVEFKNCTEPARTPFRVRLLDSDESIRKGSEKDVFYEVENYTGESIKVFFMLNSGLKAALEQTEAVLAPFETKTFKIRVTAKPDQEPRTKSLRIYAYNTEYTDQDNGRIRVIPEHTVSARLLNDNISQHICSVNELELFEFEVENNGDFEELIEFRENNPYYSVSVKYSENRFRLSPGEKKSVYVTVMPGIETTPGNKSIPVSFYASSRKNKDFTLNFTVIETPNPIPPAQGRIRSFPASTEITGNRSRTVSVEIQNQSDYALSNAVLEFDETSNELQIDSQTVSLNAGESKIITVSISAKEVTQTQVIPVTLKLTYEGTVLDTQTLQVSILPSTPANTRTNSPTPVSGLVGLFPDSTGWLIGIAFLALVFIIGISSSKGINSRWLESKQRRETRA
ncbi:MAG: hypothetical protein HY917_00335, partial [Candidatus Diapherotrites archaeon]|nr:hypothetical protein [Candidatus Diapherotrites archaeon]